MNVAAIIAGAWRSFWLVTDRLSDWIVRTRTGAGINDGLSQIRWTKGPDS